jgi:type I restriction enzyme R subunit
MASPTSANFQFLAAHDTLFLSFGALADRYFTDHPITCVMKLRQFGEQLAIRVAAHCHISSEGLKQFEFLNRLATLPHNTCPKDTESVWSPAA